MDLRDLPSLVFTDASDEVMEHPFYRMAVFDGERVRAPREHELRPLPAGSDLFLLPGRSPVGLNPDTGGPEVLGGMEALSGFASPSYLRLTHPAYSTGDDAPRLPLYAYAPLGIRRGRLYTTVMRVDRSHRQDPERFNRRLIGRRSLSLVRRHPRNRLIEHLRHCAMVYGCRAAQNFFLGREECPLPTASTCNATCLGCLSHQPPGGVRASHDRIEFTPSPEEIAEVALIHIDRVRRPVVSFGQGCEGEPLMVADTLVEAVKQIRRSTGRGTINLNTNGSNPKAVADLCEAGLDAIRLSVNSFREPVYESYFRPRGYTLNDVLASGRTVRDSGGFVSVNLLVFPGVSDRPSDLEATLAGLREVGADLVQMRNLNIDPEDYLAVVGPTKDGSPNGLAAAMDRMKGAFPALRFGYFNPPVRTLVEKRRR